MKKKLDNLTTSTCFFFTKINKIFFSNLSSKVYRRDRFWFLVTIFNFNGY